MYNWKKMCSNEAAYSGLKDELQASRGRYILDGVVLPDTCGNEVRDIEFHYYSENHIVLLYVGDTVNYFGNDDSIAEWFINKQVDFRSFNELKAFLSKFKDDFSADNCPEPTDDENNIPDMPEMKYDKAKVKVVTKGKTFSDVNKDVLIASINKEIFGQEENIEKIAHLVCNHIGTKQKMRPLSIFLYGPTGIGKSAVIEVLVKEINKQLKGMEKFAYRPVDCTQFQEHHDISRLIGSPPGYVGFAEPGVFSILEENPNTVFVFEEIEKAAPNVSETIMQAMETGRQETNGKALKDGKQFYDLSKSIIFFTSNITVDDKKPNLGFSATDDTEISYTTVYNEPSENSHNIARIIGRETKEAKEKLAETGRIRREVIGRMNAVIKFNRIPDSAIVDIAAKCISDVASKEHLLYITELNEELLQEFINETSEEIKQFGVRSLRNEAQYYFSDAFRDFSHNCEDYTHIKVSGTLDAIIIDIDDTDFSHNDN